MILGLGLDVVELSRMLRSWERFGMRLADRLLHPDEKSALRAPEARFLASRFAAKEAAAKALGTGFANGVNLHDISVRSLATGRPELVLHGGAARRASDMGVVRMHLSLTHGRETVAAVVILEGKD